MGGILQMTKLPHHHAYPAGSTDLAVAGLLTVWSSLVDYQEDLVLVGGLVPQFLCTRPPEALPAVTMDVDLGIALGATGGQYGTISSHLQGLGFKQENQRFWRDIDGLPIFVDFLTETGQRGPTAAMVDDVPVSSFPGINRALENYRTVTVSGRDAYGASQACRVKVCEIGPWLVLKLNAFAHRQQPKDAFDLYQGVLYYDRGRDAAATRFKEEAALNPGHAHARTALGVFFASAEAPGPIRCAEFMIGGLRGQISESDYQFRRGRIVNDMADIAGILVA
jgi:predicted nucleotidyltransferase